MGFTFDDANPDATPVAEMERLIAKDNHNAERIFPYIGGEEVNESPTHAYRRYIIDFFDLTEPEARDWPDLMAIVQAKVQPIRIHLKREALVRNWWQYAEKRPGLRRAIQGLNRVLVVSRVTQYLGFAFLPSGTVFAETLVVFPSDSFADLCGLQSRLHEIWVRLFASTLEDRLRYSPSDCFDTFPTPTRYGASAMLERVGHAYYEFRSALMIKNNEGLTQTYNRFHNPHDTSHEIIRLRELHDAMDRAVLDAYGWTDIRPRCEFLLDYEKEDGEDSRRKKPWRYRWPDEIRDEVLERLLALNAQRAEEERLAGAASERKGGAKSNLGAPTERKGGAKSNLGAPSELRPPKRHSKQQNPRNRRAIRK
jgi:hypothetical protein